MSVKLLTEHHLEFLSLTGGCTESSESPHVKMPHCWKSHVTAHLCYASLPGSASAILAFIAPTRGQAVHSCSIYRQTHARIKKVLSEGSNSDNVF